VFSVVGPWLMTWLFILIALGIVIVTVDLRGVENCLGCLDVKLRRLLI
jgi:hypothetical protein